MFEWLKGTNRQDRLTGVVERATESVLARLAGEVESELERYTEVHRLTAAIAVLRDEKAKLEAAGVLRVAVWERKEMDIEHKTGLLQQQHEQELKLAKKEAVLDAQVEVQQVKADEFEARQDLIADQLERTEELLGKVLERLPDARMTFGRKESSKE